MGREFLFAPYIRVATLVPEGDHAGAIVVPAKDVSGVRTVLPLSNHGTAPCTTTADSFPDDNLLHPCFCSCGRVGLHEIVIEATDDVLHGSGGENPLKFFKILHCLHAPSCSG